LAIHEAFARAAPDRRWPADSCAGSIDTRSGYVERHLSSRRSLVGDDPTIADLSLSGYLHFGRESVLRHRDASAMARWLERLTPAGVAPALRVAAGEPVAPRE
jgi:glutathione S-transferase